MSSPFTPILSCAPSEADAIFARAPQHLAAACERRDPRAAQDLWHLAVARDRFDLAAIAAGTVGHVGALVSLLTDAWRRRSQSQLDALADILGISLDLDGLDTLDVQLRRANGRLVVARAPRDRVAQVIVEALLSGWHRAAWQSRPSRSGGPSVLCCARFVHGDDAMLDVCSMRVSSGTAPEDVEAAVEAGARFPVDIQRMHPGLRTIYDAPQATLLTRTLAQPSASSWQELGLMLDIYAETTRSMPDEVSARVARALDAHWPIDLRVYPCRAEDDPTSAGLLASLASTLQLTGELCPLRLKMLIDGELPCAVDALWLGGLDRSSLAAVQRAIAAGRLDRVTDIVLEADAPSEVIRMLANRIGPQVDALQLMVPPTLSFEAIAARETLIASTRGLRRLFLHSPGPWVGSDALIPALGSRVGEVEWLQLLGVRLGPGRLCELVGGLSRACEYLSLSFCASADDVSSAILSSDARHSLRQLEVRNCRLGRRRKRRAPARGVAPPPPRSFTEGLAQTRCPLVDRPVDVGELRELPSADARATEDATGPAEVSVVGGALPSLRVLSLGPGPLDTLAAAALDSPVVEASIAGLETSGATLAAWIRGAWRERLVGLEIDDDRALVDALFDDGTWPALSALTLEGPAADGLLDVPPAVLPNLRQLCVRGCARQNAEAVVASLLATRLSVLHLERPADEAGIVRAIRRGPRLDARVVGVPAVAQMGSWRRLDFDRMIDRFSETLLRPTSH